MDKPAPSTDSNCVEAACAANTLAAFNRRKFLFGSATAVVWLTLPGGQRVQAEQAKHPRVKVGSISKLTVEQPTTFRYPVDHPLADCTLVMLKETAGGGVGPEKNIVAFSEACTHQGASMTGTFDGAASIAGPCPLHWTTFDLSRHGMVISGHATSPLPQILLETDGDEIYAVGVQGLVYGFAKL